MTDRFTRTLIRGTTALALTLAAGAFTPAMAQDAAPSPRASENRAVLTARQDPGTLDFVKSNLTALRLWIPANVVEPLIYLDQAGNATPGVAESWDINDEKTEYTFHIRETNFSDGSPVTADDVVYSLNAMQNSPVSANAAAYGAVKSIEKVGDRSVKVALDRPSQGFWNGMGAVSGLIQPEAAAGGIATNPIGTGPYMLAEYVSNSHMLFKVNPEYWAEEPALKEVRVRIVTDGTAGLNAVDAGEVDAAPVNTIDLWEQIVNRGLDKKFALVTYPQIGEPTYAVVNQKIDPEIRQAIAMTLDRQAFNDAFGASWGAENTCTFALPDQSWYSPESEESCPYPYDYEGAMQIIKENGYGDQTLEYASLSDVPDLSLPADLMVPLMQGAGFDVKRNAMDLARYAQLIFQGRPPQFDVTIMSGDSNPAQYACENPSKAGWSTYCSEEYTAALGAADSSLTREDYDMHMKEAARILRDDAVIIPIIAKQGVGLFHPALKGFQEPRVAVAIEFAPLHW